MGRRPLHRVIPSTSTHFKVSNLIIHQHFTGISEGEQESNHVNISHLAINPQLLDTLALYAQYAAASYCTFNIEHPSGPDPLNCHGLEDVANPVGGPVGAGPNPAQKRKQKRQEVAAGNGTQIDVCPRVETLQTKTLFEWEK